MQCSYFQKNNAQIKDEIRDRKRLGETNVPEGRPFKNINENYIGNTVFRISNRKGESKREDTSERKQDFPGTYSLMIIFLYYLLSSLPWQDMSGEGQDNEVITSKGKRGGRDKVLVRKFCEILVGFFFFRPTTAGEIMRLVERDGRQESPLWEEGGKRLIIIKFESTKLCGEAIKTLPAKVRIGREMNFC